MNSIMDNRTFRISLNVFCGAFLTWLYAMVGSHLIATKPYEISVPWCSFLAVLFALTWMWVGLESSRPHPYLPKQKEMAAAASFALTYAFGALAIGITAVRTYPESELMVIMGYALMASSPAFLPWMLRKMGLI